MIYLKNNIISIDSSKEYTYHIDKLIERYKTEIFTWFKKQNENCKVKVFIYKDLPSLVEGLRKRGFTYPDYMCACMIDEDEKNNISRSINLYEPSKNPSSNEFTKKEYDNIVLHELIHYITNYLYGTLPEWLTEGIANYLDKSYKEDLTGLLKIINEYEIPLITDMQGDNFVKKESGRVVYDGYDLSYLMIRYIIENIGLDYLFSLMETKNFNDFNSDKCLKDAIEYYNCVYNEEKNYQKSQNIV